MQELKCPNCGKTFQVDEAGYASIVKQVRDEEFSKDLKDKEEQFELDKAQAIQIAKMEAEKNLAQQLSEKDIQIAQLKTEIEANELAKNNQIQNALSQKEKEISELQHKLDHLNKDKELEIANLVNKNEKQITELKIQEQTNKVKYENILKYKDDEIERLKDFKAKQSVKILGENLEQHCKTVFEQSRALGFTHAYFEKDNDASKGSKGDFIFRDYDDGNEYISIMFDMKNEADISSTKKKNEDFLEKLDKDRKQKKCEYAVLVSMLEQDNELYNTGIVDVSYKYEKMYVVRPQFFLPIITLLRNASRNTIKYKKELDLIRKQDKDVTDFEDRLNDFKDKFSKNVIESGKKFQTAIDEIDKTIEHLKKVKDNLLSSEKKLLSANNKLEDLTIKKLTKDNPTMQEKFKEAKKSKQKQLPKNE